MALMPQEPEAACHQHVAACARGVWTVLALKVYGALDIRARPKSATQGACEGPVTACLFTVVFCLGPGPTCPCILVEGGDVLELLNIRIHGGLLIAETQNDRSFCRSQ